MQKNIGVLIKQNGEVTMTYLENKAGFSAKQIMENELIEGNVLAILNDLKIEIGGTQL